MGLWLWLTGRLELPFPKHPQHYGQQVQRPPGGLFRCVLHLSVDHLGMDCQKIRLSHHIYDRSCCPRGRMPSVLAKRRQKVIWGFLW